MSLYYDKKIRRTAVKEWEEAKIPNMDFSGSGPGIPEDQVDSQDSYLFKDTKVPLYFKNCVTQWLYEAEEEEIKQIVRSTCEEKLLTKTAYSLCEEEWLELVEEYQKYATSFVPCILG